MIGVLFCFSKIVLAQDIPMTDDQLEFKLSSIKSPFASQLPVEEVEKLPVIKDATTGPKPDPAIDTRSQQRNRRTNKNNEVDGPSKTKVSVKEEEPIEPLPELKVSGVIWNSDRPQAIINDHVINIGDTILGVKITDIRQGVIEGEFHGRTVNIKTQRSSI